MVSLALLLTVILCTTVATGAPSYFLGIQQADVKVSSNTLKLIEKIISQEVYSTLTKSYLGLSPECPAVSCKQIAELKPRSASGYYWIQGVSRAVGVYCEMEGNKKFNRSGGWMRTANVDMRNDKHYCPPGLVYNVTEGKRLCGKPD